MSLPSSSNEEDDADDDDSMDMSATTTPERPKDVIAVAGVTAPNYLPAGALILVRVSPLQLIDGYCSDLVLWDPARCRADFRAKMTRIMADQSPKRGNAMAVWEWIAGGPDAVERWRDLPEDFCAATRRDLGLVELNGNDIELVCCAEDD